MQKFEENMSIFIEQIEKSCLEMVTMGKLSSFDLLI